MGKRPFFRDHDRVTVHGHMEMDGKVTRGRVISTDRKSLYGQTLVVLVDLGDHEAVETFCADGTRYIPGQKLRVTLGWEGPDG